MPLFFCGPSGGVGGNFFNNDDMTPGPGLLEECSVLSIRVNHGALIDRVTLSLRVQSSGQVFTVAFGGSGGNVSNVTLQPDEFIQSISGRYGQFVDSMRITLMNAGTGNQRTLPRFGGRGGTEEYFYQAPLPPPPRRPLTALRRADTGIVGFWGKAGAVVDAIGVILRRPL